MRYSSSSALNAVYELIARLAQPDDPDQARPDNAMTIAASLAELGEDQSWASVWWAYGAIHYEMSDDALARGLDLLARVSYPNEARAAACMLEAEIKMAQAVYAGFAPSPAEQRTLLEDAVALAPEWPSLRLRLARACKLTGDELAAREQVARAALLFRQCSRSLDPFDSAITGRNLDREYVERELEALGNVVAG